MLLAVRGSVASEYCVADESDLAKALFSAQSNGVDDVIRLRTGIYRSRSQSALAFSASISDGKSIAISGGWQDALCLEQQHDARLTVIDGEGEAQGMQLIATGANELPISVSWITVRNTLSSNNVTRGYGLYVGANDYVNSHFLIENCIFSNNRDEGNGLSIGAVAFSASDGYLVLRNSLFVDNRGSLGSALFLAATGHGGAARASVTNNTFTRNETTGDFGLTVYSAGGPITFENNVVWANAHASEESLDFYGFFASSLRNNDIEYLDVISGGGPASMSGNVSIDPGFVGSTDFHLRFDSLVRDRGAPNPDGGFGDIDLDGISRVLNGRVDMGAYENDRIFGSAFDRLP